MSISVRGLAHICIYTASLSRSMDFYTGALGFVCSYRQDRKDMLYAEIRSGTCIMELLEWKDPARSSGRAGQQGVIDHFALEVTNLDLAVAGLLQAGVPIEAEPFSLPDLLGGVRGLFIQGPDGENIELFQLAHKTDVIIDGSVQGDS